MRDLLTSKKRLTRSLLLSLSFLLSLAPPTELSVASSAEPPSPAPLDSSPRTTASTQWTAALQRASTEIRLLERYVAQSFSLGEAGQAARSFYQLAPAILEERESALAHLRDLEAALTAAPSTRHRPAALVVLYRRFGKLRMFQVHVRKVKASARRLLRALQPLTSELPLPPEIDPALLESLGRLRDPIATLTETLAGPAVEALLTQDSRWFAPSAPELGAALRASLQRPDTWHGPAPRSCSLPEQLTALPSPSSLRASKPASLTLSALDDPQARRLEPLFECSFSVAAAQLLDWIEHQAHQLTREIRPTEVAPLPARLGPPTGAVFYLAPEEPAEAGNLLQEMEEMVHLLARVRALEIQLLLLRAAAETNGEQRSSSRRPGSAALVADEAAMGAAENQEHRGVQVPTAASFPPVTLAREEASVPLVAAPPAPPSPALFLAQLNATLSTMRASMEEKPTWGGRRSVITVQDWKEVRPTLERSLGMRFPVSDEETRAQLAEAIKQVRELEQRFPTVALFSSVQQHLRQFQLPTPQEAPARLPVLPAWDQGKDEL